MKTLITLLLLFFSTSYTLADDTSSTKILKEYDIEIILFEDAHARYLTSESWKKNIITQYPAADESEIDKMAEHPDDFSLHKTGIEEIKTEHFQSIKPAILSRQYQRIKASSEYNVLFYGAWRQAGLDKSQSFEININELENTHASKSDNTMTGTFRLVLRRFLHMHSQLYYQRVVAQSLPRTRSGGSAVNEPKDGKIRAEMYSTVADSITNEKHPGSTDTIERKLSINILNRDTATHDSLYQLYLFPINSHRRMRSKVLHYIDHPLVGMLIQINPVEKTKEIN